MFDSMFNKFIDWLDNTTAWEKLFSTLNLYNIRLKGYPDFPMSDYFKIVDKAKPTSHYIFLSTDSKSLSSIVIKGVVKTFGSNSSQGGLFSHAGLVFFNGDRNTTLMHVRDVGLIEQPMIDFLKQIDYLCVIKLPIKKKHDPVIDIRIADLRKRAKYIEYDWAQHLDNDENKIYCSELIYDLFKNLVDSPNFKPRMMLGREVFDPDLLITCGEIIYTNHPKLIKI
jgi:hypothetical protein